MPKVLQVGIMDMQVCVPDAYSDVEAVAFAEKEYPCGTSGGWSIVREGSEWLAGDPERAKCVELADHVHIMLEA